MTDSQKEKLAYFLIGPWGLALAVVLAPVLVFGGWYALGHTRYGEGYRDGVLQKFSHKGLVFKTDEAELAMDGIRLGNGAGGSVWAFSATEKSVAFDLRHTEPGRRVRVYYTEYLANWPPARESAYQADRVELLP